MRPSQLASVSIRNQVPWKLDDKETMRQLRCTGMLQAVRIRAAGYSHREPHATFLHRFGRLLPAHAPPPPPPPPSPPPPPPALEAASAEGAAPNEQPWSDGGPVLRRPWWSNSVTHRQGAVEEQAEKATTEESTAPDAAAPLDAAAAAGAVGAAEGGAAGTARLLSGLCALVGLGDEQWQCGATKVFLRGELSAGAPQKDPAQAQRSSLPPRPTHLLSWRGVRSSREAASLPPARCGAHAAARPQASSTARPSPTTAH